MTCIEREIRYSFCSPYYRGKKCFGNTRISTFGWDVKTIYVKVNGIEKRIAARIGDKFFYNDPLEGKSKLVNSRLAFLRSQFSMQEVSQETIDILLRIGTDKKKTLYDTFYVVKSRNNRTRYFRTMCGAVDFSGSPHKVWAPFTPVK